MGAGNPTGNTTIFIGPLRDHLLGVMQLEDNMNSTKQQNFRPVQFKIICSRQMTFNSHIEICFWKSRKHCGERRKCWLPAFSPFPTMFSKALVYRVIKTQDCVVKG